MVIAVAVRSNLLPPKEMRLIWAYSRDHARSSYWGSFLAVSPRLSPSISCRQNWPDCWLGKKISSPGWVSSSAFFEARHLKFQSAA